MRGEAEAIRVADLPNDQSILDRIIDWQIRHYGGHFPTFDRADWSVFYAARSGSADATLPIVLGAFEAGECVGTVAIVERDDLEDVELFTPWIAAMIVDPERRGRGIGTELLRSAIDRCRSIGIHKVYLWTHDQAEWYRRIGWSSVELRSFRGVQIEVLSRNT